jgi:hypothetical protein
MMQNGLHIGLAAWISEQRNTGSFAVYPTQPLVTELVDLDAIQNVQDLAKAAEFSRLVNFIPRQGQVADTLSDSARLWQVHRDLLGQMDFATEPWTKVEQAEYQAARETLYTMDNSGLPTPSKKYHLYEEMKNAYCNLSDSGGDADEITRAMSDWIVLGYKLEIEDAFEVIGRLWGRSSRNQADNERLSLNEYPPGVGLRFYGDMEFAPVYFAPVSAIARETWMETKVSFDDLDRAVCNRAHIGKWKAYRANRTGEVLFDYAILTCMRPWFTPAIYKSDDWKLSTDNTVVSKGNGAEGLLPAYVDAVYLVSVKNVITKPKPPRLKPKPKLTARLINTTTIGRAKHIHQSLRPTSLGDANTNVGIVKKTVNTPIAMRKVSSSNRLLPSRQLSGVQATTIATSQFTLMNLGQLRRVTTVNLKLRYTVARAYLEGGAWTAHTSTEETMHTEIYVVGFGCEKISFAPNPNLNYRW